MSPTIYRPSGQAARFHLEKRAVWNGVQKHQIAPVVELVDAADSKSAIGNDVGVQVPPGAPFLVYDCLLSFENRQKTQ